MRIICLMILTLSVSAFAAAQSTTVIESAYYVAPAYRGQQKVIFAVVVSNPFEDKFASYPQVRVTARATDGSIIATQDFSSAGIPPRGTIAFCNSMLVDETPSRVDIRPLDARYEPTPFKPSQFLPFEIFNVTPKADFGNRLRVTGEVKNPYMGETGIWLTFLYRDEKGKLLGGYTAYESTVPPGEPTPFEFYVDIAEIPPTTKKIDRMAFCHNNFQSSWHKLLKAQ